MNREAIEKTIAALKAGKTPELTVDDVPAFSLERTAGNRHISPGELDTILDNLSSADIPTFERALRAIEEGDLAWIGFKIVYDAEAAMSNVDNEVTKKYGEVGSADGEPLVFFCNDAKEIVSSRAPSPRDVFQMKDVTRGPSMHNEQFEGLTWTSVALFDPIRVWLLGASDVASELEALAAHVGFSVVALDYDPAYLNEDRFPHARRILLDSPNFDGLAAIQADADDFACVLTRGHMFDPQACLWAIRQGVSYVGMMGCAGKNDTVHELVRSQGMSESQWQSVKRPIGLKFGAKTPAELAIAIVAELIDERYKRRYSQEARDKHERSLGR